MPERNKVALGAPSFVDVSAEDRETAGQFYTTVFGWGFDPVGPRDAVRGYAWLTQGGRKVAGVGPHVDDTDGPKWTTYIEVDDCDAMVAAAEKAGATLERRMDISPIGKFAYLFDPQGALFGLWQSGEHTGAGVVNEPNSLCWNQLATTDLDAAVDFYGGLFGWQRRLVDVGPDFPPYNSMDLDGEPVVGFTPVEQAGAGKPAPSWRASGGDQPQWIPHFAVADCEKTAELIEANGGTIVSPPQDGKAGRGAACRDPQGAYFAIIKLAGA